MERRGGERTDDEVAASVDEVARRNVDEVAPLRAVVRVVFSGQTLEHFDVVASRPPRADGDRDEERSEEAGEHDPLIARERNGGCDEHHRVDRGRSKQEGERSGGRRSV